MEFVPDNIPNFMASSFAAFTPFNYPPSENFAVLITCFCDRLLLPRLGRFVSRQDQRFRELPFSEGPFGLNQEVWVVNLQLVDFSAYRL